MHDCVTKYTNFISDIIVTYGTVEVQLHSFLSTAPNAEESSVSCPNLPKDIYFGSL
jgi:hypothetical protein